MKKKVLHLGVSGFPHGNAVMQRVKVTFKALKKAGFDPIIISKKSLYNYDNNVKRVQTYEGIPYVQTSYILNRPKSFLIRSLNKLSGLWGELLLLIKLRKQVHTALVYTPYFLELVYYKLLSVIFQFKTCLVYVELRSSIPHRQSGFIKLNDKLFDRYCSWFSDSAIVISEYLKERLLKQKPALKILKVPAVTDFEYFEKTDAYNSAYGYLMYCGTISYSEVIIFIIDLFETIKKDTGYRGQLVMVISGEGSHNWQVLNDRIKRSDYKEFIIIKSNISYQELTSYYKGADILIIPLRPTLQDIARFPHKISEYTAAARAILSTNIGEMKYYFEDKKTAILANEYSIQSYHEKVKDIILDNAILEMIGKNGNKIGNLHFNINNYSTLFKNFFTKIK